jgi:hypothetical protein
LNNNINGSTELHVDPWNFGYWNVSDTYGGKRVSLQVSKEVTDAINWVTSYRASLEAEAAMRASNPALKELYDQYQTMLKLLAPQAA